MPEILHRDAVCCWCDSITQFPTEVSVKHSCCKNPFPLDPREALSTWDPGPALRTNVLVMFFEPLHVRWYGARKTLNRTGSAPVSGIMLDTLAFRWCVTGKNRLMCARKSLASHQQPKPALLTPGRRDAWIHDVSSRLQHCQQQVTIKPNQDSSVVQFLDSFSHSSPASPCSVIYYCNTEMTAWMSLATVFWLLRVYDRCLKKRKKKKFTSETQGFTS